MDNSMLYENMARAAIKKRGAFAADLRSSKEPLKFIAATGRRKFYWSLQFMCIMAFSLSLFLVLANGNGGR